MEGSEVYSVVDLFAGAGGLSCGFSSVTERDRGDLFETIQAIEIERDPAATFKQNFPKAEVVHGDIREVVNDGLVGECDVVLGGPPCQGFSRLGRGDPKGVYNDLWRSYALSIKRASPRYFVMENVPQFLSSPERLFFEEEIENGMLRDYVIAPIRVLNCSDYGVPQNRKRMVILGSRRDQVPLSYPMASDLPAPTVSQTFADLEEKVTDTELPNRMVEIDGVKRPGPFASRELHIGRQYSELSRKRFESISIPGGNRFDLPDDLKPDCWKKHGNGNTDVMGRLHGDRPSVTIRTEFFKPEKGRYLHPTENRAITHFEATRLMGFPDGYKWIGSKTSIARQIGNAVPPPFAEALGKTVAQALKHSGR